MHPAGSDMGQPNGEMQWIVARCVFLNRLKIFADSLAFKLAYFYPPANGAIAPFERQASQKNLACGPNYRNVVALSRLDSRQPVIPVANSGN
jgi:hypothetical protein